MEKLWSPWRSQYIDTFKEEKEPLPGSLFTRILAENDDRKNYLLHRGKNCFIIMNLYPYNSGHLMIVPYKEVKELTELDDKTRLEMFLMLELGIKALTEVMKPHGFNIGANLGRVAGAGIEDHLHFHIVPRWNGDTNFMPVLNDVKVISEEMGRTYKKLKVVIDTLVKQ
ncbi:MAG TPA: HIT domain-containing protein [Ignavibacteria bacterium]|nr:HIT domain-containing protein [Ignavibacteria bacterium]